MRQWHFLAVTLAVVIVATSSRAQAPQSESGIRLGGTVVDVEWTNPNAIIRLNAETAGSGAELGPWILEGPSPNKLLRMGMTRDSLRPGSKLIVFVERQDKAHARITQIRSACRTKIFFPGGPVEVCEPF